MLVTVTFILGGVLYINRRHAHYFREEADDDDEATACNDAG